MTDATVTIPVCHPGFLQSEIAVRFTDAAVAHLDNGDLSAIAQACLADLTDVTGLDELEPDEDYDLADVAFHVVEAYSLFMTFDADGALLDVVEYEHGAEPIGKGPLAGKTLAMPVGKTKR